MRLKSLSIYFVPALTLLLCVIAFFNVILHMDVFAWDQSHHALYGVWIARDIAAGNWTAFWAETHRQAFWPFLHSWIIALGFLTLGFNYTAARLVNLILFFFLLVGVWLAGRALDREKGAWIGGLAWLLAATSSLLWSLGTDNMIETLGAVLTIYAFISLLRLVQTDKWVWIAPAGILLSLLIITKYNYAIFALGSAAVWAAVGLFPLFRPGAAQPKKMKKQNKNQANILSPLYQYLLKYGLLFLPSVLMFAWWMFGPESERKWQMVLFNNEHVVNITELAGYTFPQLPYEVNKVLFYFVSLVHDFPWFTLFGGLSVLALFAVPFLIKKHGAPAILLTIFCWLPLLISIFFIGRKDGRFIATFVPIIYLATAYCLVFFWSAWKTRLSPQKSKLILAAGLLLAALAVAPQLNVMFDFFAGRNLPTDGQRLMAVMDFFKENIPPDAPIASGLSLPELSPYDFYIHFCSRGAPVVNLYSLPQAKLAKGYYLITLRFEPDSKYYKDETVLKWNEIIARNSKFLKVIKKEAFPKLNLTAEIYLIK